jgi:hypothetical protein
MSDSALSIQQEIPKFTECAQTGTPDNQKWLKYIIFDYAM